MMRSSKSVSRYGTKAKTRKTSRTKRNGTKRSARVTSGSAAKGGGKHPTSKPFMTPIEYRGILRKNFSEMTQEGFPAMLLQGPRTIRRHLKGDAQIAGPQTALMRLISRGIFKRRHILEFLPRH